MTTFKEYLSECDTPPHLCPRAEGKQVKFDSEHQFKGALMGSWRAAKKLVKKDEGKTYYQLKDKIVAVWDSIGNSGFVVQK